MPRLALAICATALAVASAANAGPEDFRTCTIGTADALRAYLSTTPEADREAIIASAMPLTGARGSDCGLTAVSEMCDLIFVADGAAPLAVVVGVGAPDGPMPQTSAALHVLAASKLTPSGVVLHHVDQVQDQELLALITAEVREMISQNGFDGVGLPVCQCGPECEPKSQN